jgi:D-tyrosyl-tRNA(Tyr) deacylase
MRVLIQRVSRADVTIDGTVRASIGLGMVILLGIEEADSAEDVDWICGKISRLRIFPDDQGVMNRSVMEVNGEIMVISQFTLHASTKKGNRPSYIRAARPETAIPLYEAVIAKLQQETGKAIKTGEFGAMMDIGMVNAGPVSIWIDSKNKE